MGNSDIDCTLGKTSCKVFSSNCPICLKKLEDKNRRIPGSSDEGKKKGEGGTKRKKEESLIEYCCH